MSSIENNIRKIYLFQFFKFFLVFIPILIPYQEGLGLSMKEIMLLQSFFGLFMAILEVPSGYIADLFGRKKTLIIGAFFSGCGFSLYPFATSFWDFIYIEILLAIGLSFCSGTDISILYDSLENSHASQKVKKTAIAKLGFYANFSEGSAAILAGIVVLYSIKTPFYINMFTGWIPFIIALSFIEPKIQRASHKETLKNFREIYQILFHNKFTFYIFANFIIWSLATFCAVWIFQKHWSDHKIPLFYFGFLWASYNITVGIISRFVPYLEERMSIQTLIYILCALPIIGYFGMSLESALLGVFFGFFFQISRGISQVIFLQQFNHQIPSRFRSTLQSIKSLFFRFTFFILGPCIGYSIDSFSLALTLQLLGVFFIFFFIIFTLPYLKTAREEELK